MDMHELTRDLHQKNDSKIVLLVADGLGGLPIEQGGPTELEAAHTPHLDELARSGTSGSMIPVAPGITPGSGPGHLGLFGYDPLVYRIGRGALEATGIGIELQAGDVAARCNFCTLAADGTIADRRAGRISTEESVPLVHRLQSINIHGVSVVVEPVKEHRFVVVFRAAGLGDDVRDSDPQALGVPPLDPQPLGPVEDSASARTADAARTFIAAARTILASEKKANGLTMRGFSARPALPPYSEVYGLRAAAIAVYPMYKGLARLVGMEVVGQPATLADQIDLVERNWKAYDFFFVHFKYTDSTGEDGDFAAKVKRIEELNAMVPRIRALRPTVLAVTGDHSTPSRLRTHSWHPVPTLIAAESCRPDACTRFGERDALTGGLGHFEAKYLMPLLLAHAGRLAKFGA